MDRPHGDASASEYGAGRGRPRHPSCTGAGNARRQAPCPCAEGSRVAQMGWVRDLARYPVIQAPMGGGPSRPGLAAAVNEAGGLGFLAGGYKSGEEMAAEIVATKRLTDLPFGVNVFVPTAPTIEAPALDAYLAQLARDAASLGTALGPSDWNDDD